MMRIRRACVAAARPQQRHMTGQGVTYEGNVHDIDDLKKFVRATYRQIQQNVPYIKKMYCIGMPIPMMRARIRHCFEMNRNVSDPQAIWRLMCEAREENRMALTGIFTTPAYLQSKYFSTMGVTVFDQMHEVWQNREILIGKQKLRDRAEAIARGEELFPALPGAQRDAEGNVTGYSHPKGPLPPGESELFARPPQMKDWGAFSLPDPWNPNNSPDGPPDPYLITNSEQQYRVNLARKGPYTRHRTRRLIEHEKKVRGMSEADYLEYFKENEIHLAANTFELPEYQWAEDRLNRRIRRVRNENQEIFAPVRTKWVAKYKGTFKAVAYAPALDYWLMTLEQWVPNYNKAVVAKVDTIDDEFDAFLSTPAHYAAYRSDAFATVKGNAAANPLARTFKDFVLGAQEGDAATAKRPYDHPQFENKYFTDNGLSQLLLHQEDEEAGLGCPRRDEPVLQAELGRLKDEIGCVELTEKKFGGEWHHRGQVKLLRTLAKIHDMELAAAIVAEAGAANASEADAAKKIAAKNWTNFNFNNFSYLRYPDGDAAGIHAHATGENPQEELVSRAKEIYLSLYNYDQCVPIWFQGLSYRAKLNKPASQGGWTLENDVLGFYDKMVSA